MNPMLVAALPTLGILAVGALAALVLAAVTHRRDLRPIRPAMLILCAVSTVWSLSLLSMAEDPARWQRGLTTIVLTLGPVAMAFFQLLRQRRGREAAPNEADGD
jgi:peptidoglycan/LPS O-acetylase OafA/YrhL